MEQCHLPLLLLLLPLTTWCAGDNDGSSAFRRYEQELGILSSAPTSTTHTPMPRLSGTKLISYTEADDDVGPFSQLSDSGCPAHSQRHHHEVARPGASGLTQEYSAACVCMKGYRAHAVAAAGVRGGSAGPHACLPAFLYRMEGTVQLQGGALSRATLDMWALRDLREHSATVRAGSRGGSHRYISRAFLQLREAVAAGARTATAAVMAASARQRSGVARKSDGDAAALRILDTDVLLTGASQPPSPQASKHTISSQTFLFRAGGGRSRPVTTQTLALQFELRLFSPEPPASGIAMTLTDAVHNPQFAATVLSTLQRATGAWQGTNVRAARVSATTVQATQWQSLPSADCALTPWGRWGACSVSCVTVGATSGAGSRRGGEQWQDRVRVVLHAAALGGKRCPPRAQQQQRRRCVPAAPPCPTPAPVPAPTPFPTPAGPVNCMFSDWGAWDSCSATCAASGGGGGAGSGTPVRVRSRSVLQRAMRGGMACPALRQRAACHVSLCPVDCAVARWGAWAPCSAGCGRGTRRRTRHVRARPQFGGRECPVLEHEKACVGLRPCAIDCELSRWGAWRDCDRTCGRGEQRRDRIIVRRAANGGKSCTPMLHQRRGCGAAPCPLNCRFSDWAAWGSCSVSCSASGAAGQGVRLRRRHVLVAASHGGVPCPALFERGRCGRACPIDCKLASAWGKWGACSRSCGGGRRTSSRAVLRAAAHGGKQCLGRTQAQRCARTPCSADCMVSATTWQPCSRTCGSDGTQKGARSVLLAAGRGGKPCPNLSLVRPCGRSPCPVSCKLSKWGAWNGCDYSCPNGVAAGTYVPQYQKRLRTVLRAAVGSGQSCADVAMAANEAHLLVQQRMLGDPFAPPLAHHRLGNATAPTADAAVGAHPHKRVAGWWLYERRACEAEARRPCGSVSCGHGQAEAYSLGGGAEHLRCEFDGRRGEVRALKHGLVAGHIAFKCTKLFGESRIGLQGCDCFCWARGAVGGDAQERQFEFTSSGVVRRPTPAPSPAPPPPPKQRAPGEIDGGVATLVRDPSPPSSRAAANFLHAEWASLHRQSSAPRRPQSPRLRSRGVRAAGGGRQQASSHGGVAPFGSRRAVQSAMPAVPTVGDWTGRDGTLPPAADERQQRQGQGGNQNAGSVNYALGILILLLAVKIAHQRVLGGGGAVYEATEGIELHDGTRYARGDAGPWGATAHAAHTYGRYGASGAVAGASGDGGFERDENTGSRAVNQL